MALVALISPPSEAADPDLRIAFEALGLDLRSVGPVDPQLIPDLLRLPRDWQAAYAPETLKSRATDLRRFVDWAEGMDESLFASRQRLPDLASAALTDLSHSLGHQSFCRLASHLSAFLKGLGLPDSALMHRRRMAVRSANRNARARRATLRGDRKRVWLSSEGLSRLAAATQRHDLPPLTRIRDGAILAVMCELLLRRSEVGDLRLIDWDANKRYLTLRHGKTDQMGRGVSYHLSEKTAVRLEAWLARSGLDDLHDPQIRAATPIFAPLHKSGCIRRDGAGNIPALTGASVARLLKQHGIAAGLTGVCGHTPRRSVARIMKQAGLSDADICRAGRWESVEVMRGYAGLVEAREGAGVCLAEIGL